MPEGGRGATVQAEKLRKSSEVLTPGLKDQFADGTRASPAPEHDIRSDVASNRSRGHALVTKYLGILALPEDPLSHHKLQFHYVLLA